jgi:hypothetical protein
VKLDTKYQFFIELLYISKSYFGQIILEIIKYTIFITLSAICFFYDKMKVDIQNSEWNIQKGN